MTARIYPADAVTGAPSYTGRYLRQTLSPLVPGATSARPLGAQSGVRPGTPATTVSVAASTWTVTPHAGVLDLEASASAGPYLYAFDANVTGSVNAAHATYTRWDGIYVQLSDPAESDGTANPGVAIVYVAGTASASPAMPTQPARSLLLARIVVPNSGGGSASVVWLAPAIICAPPGVASLAELQARHPSAPVGARFVQGARTVSTDTLWIYEFDGYQWVVITSPWQAMSPAAGFTAYNFPGCRLMGGLLTFQGGFSGSLTAGAYTQIGTVPAGFWPAENYRGIRILANASDPTKPVYGYVTSAGAVMAVATTTGSYAVILGGMSGYSVL